MRYELIKSIESMTQEEIYQSIYRDHLTGCLNRKAFDADNLPYVAIADLDSLKYINDEFGHRKGDQILCALAQGLCGVFGNDNVYRLSGDEFAVKLPTLNGFLKKIHVLRHSIPIFSFGYGKTLQAADSELKEDKENRFACGLRAVRGKKPFWADHFDHIIGYKNLDNAPRWKRLRKEQVKPVPVPRSVDDFYNQAPPRMSIY